MKSYANSFWKSAKFTKLSPLYPDFSMCPVRQIDPAANKFGGILSRVLNVDGQTAALKLTSPEKTA